MRNGLVEGMTLRAVLRESGAMAPEAAASVLAGMLVTLAVVHGDVRPEHVRVDGSGGLALTGFGGGEAEFVPNVPSYLAPERLQGAPASAAADVFSATAVFFECLTNESPFVAATREDLAALHEYAEVIAEFAPMELRLLAQRGLAPDAERRASSPHAFLDEVTATATAEYGADWQQRGRALLGGWALAAARAEGVELVAAPGPSEAPPVGDPIDAALLGLGGESVVAESEPGSESESESVVDGDAAGDEAEMPPPLGEPIDEALLGADGGAEDGDDAAGEAPEAVSGEEEVASEAPAENDKDYDWFTGTGAGKTESAAESGAETDVLAVFDGARAGRTAEADPEPYTPTGFDVFADRSSEAEPESEPVSGHWDAPEADGEGEASGGKWDEHAGSALTAEDASPVADEVAAESAPEAADAAEVEDSASESGETAEAEPAFDAFAGKSEEAAEAEPEASAGEAVEAEPEAALDASANEASEAVEAEPEAGDKFDAFASKTAEAEPEASDTADASASKRAETEPEAALDASASEASEAVETEPEAGDKFDAFASKSGAAAEAVEPDPAAEPLIEDSSELLAAFDAFSPPTAEPEPEAALEPETEPEPEPEVAAVPEAAERAAEPEPEAGPEPEPEDTPPPDLEDDWIIPATPLPKVPRSLSAFAVSLPSLPRPAAEVEEPKPPVQTSAPDDWFRPGVAEPVGPDAHHTQVLNPDRDNTLESEATRVIDDAPVEMAVAAAAVGAASAKGARAGGRAGRGVQGVAAFDDFDEPGPAAGSGGPQRRTLVGVVAVAALLVAGAIAVALGGSEKAPQGTGGAPTQTSSSSTPSATTGPATPTGTSNGNSGAVNPPTSHHSSTHSRTRTSSPSATSHSSSDETATHSSSSSSGGSSSSAPSSSASSTPSSTCSIGILGLPDCGGSSGSGGPTTTGSKSPGT